jgi:glycosyltransferase involved in cell wall biosynthesis
LRRAGVCVWRTTNRGDAFDHAEALLRHAARCAPRTIVFWNVDAKVKLLVAKRLEHSAVRLIDVSPGAYAFEEMDATAEFQTCIAYSPAQYYARLQRLVLKYCATAPVHAKISVIPNGVPVPALRRRLPGTAPRNIVVSGRIVPTKFLLEIVAAMRAVWERIADARLHVLGIAEPRHQPYANALVEAAGDELQRRIFLHGAAFDAPQRLDQFDLALVIGQHQGCPNAVLEAMAAGLPVIANDSGGTRELVIDGRTGLLLADRDPDTIAAGLLRLMTDARLSERLARAGREHVVRRFSMHAMVAGYRRLLAQ